MTKSSFRYSQDPTRIEVRRLFECLEWEEKGSLLRVLKEISDLTLTTLGQRRAEEFL